MSQPLVFITGSTGFIGAHVFAQALEAGYKIRLSVRREAQIDGLKTLAGKHTSEIDFLVIPDLTVAGAFDKALQGVTYVFHVASPMPGKADDFKTTYLAPAVDGTLTLLNAAKSVESIQRVVVVSSILALLSQQEVMTGSGQITEGRSSSITINPDTDVPDDAMAKYHASKVLAHQATIGWVAKTKPHFTVVTLHPAFVFGRNLTQTSPESLDGTNAMFMGVLGSEKASIPLVAVDVTDVARAHIRALDLTLTEKDKVHEFVLMASAEDGWTWEKIGEYVRKNFPQVELKLQPPFGDIPSSDTRKAREVLGIKFKSMEETVGELLGQQTKLRAQI